MQGRRQSVDGDNSDGRLVAWLSAYTAAEPWPVVGHRSVSSAAEGPAEHDEGSPIRHGGDPNLRSMSYNAQSVTGAILPCQATRRRRTGAGSPQIDVA
jgi:hypothetical protein